ncbi:MAG: hypothetical protein KGH65_03790 [Candidatus Micrarchaeota archaeon]|nr:hypothetical protein [Candidatus Micrarchaeota archaeon]
MGPFGSGKSSGCVVELIKLAHRQPIQADGVRRSRFAVIRNSYIQLRDTTIKTFHDWLPPELFGEWWKSEHNYYITKFPGVYIEILFRALDRPDQVANLLSAEYTGAWVNEAREVPMSVIEALQGRVKRYPGAKDGGCVDGGIIMDTNPPDTDSEWYRLFEEKRPANAALFKQPSGRSQTAENLAWLNQTSASIKLPVNDPTRRALGREYYDNLAQGKDPDFVKVYIDGEYGYVKDGRPVYSEYNDAIHCKECGPVQAKPIRRGWDFGLTPAVSFSQLLPSGQWIVFDEIAADSLGIDRFSDTVLAYTRETWGNYSFMDFGDPAGNQRAQTDEKTCYEILRSKGINIEPGEISDSIRIESVKKPMNTMIDGKPGFLLHPRCKRLRKGFLGKYRYRRLLTSDERYTDKPEKNEYSHIHDALQYDASRLFSDKLRGKVEWRKVELPRLKRV